MKKIWNRKPNRTIYRLWHNKSAAGRIGYIGKDKYHPDRLKLAHRRKFDVDCKKLYRALNKYSLEIWHTEILASGFESDADMNKAEVYWIKKFDSKNKGYNCTNGGEGFIGLKFTKEHCDKISKSHQGKKNPMYGVKGKDHPRYGIKHSDETKKKISDALKGEKNINWGKKWPQSAIKKMSESKLGRKNPMWGKKVPAAQRKKIREFMLGNTYALGYKQSKETKEKRMQTRKNNLIKQQKEGLLDS